MKNLVRGGAILSLLSVFVVFIYAQNTTESRPEIATDSHLNLAHINSNNINLDNQFLTRSLDKATAEQTLIQQTTGQEAVKKQEGGKKLVKTTASVRATGAGASKGSFSASAYCLSGKTAMGHGVRRGIIAADPRVLKLGSRVTIDAGPWSGTYLVSDTGGAIKGKKIDIWVPNCSEARKFGRRSVQIYTN